MIGLFKRLFSPIATLEAEMQEIIAKEIAKAKESLAERDREWVARELGDVPIVTAKDRPAYDKTPAFSAATTDALMFGTGAYKLCPDGTALPVDMYVDPECFWG